MPRGQTGYLQAIGEYFHQDGELARQASARAGGQTRVTSHGNVDQALVVAHEALDASSMEWRKTAGLVVAACRKEKGLTQQQLGKLRGRSRGWVAKLESGGSSW